MLLNNLIDPQNLNLSKCSWVSCANWIMPLYILFAVPREKLEERLRETEKVLTSLKLQVKESNERIS